MIKYELRKVSADVALKDKDLIKPGFAMEYNIKKHSNGDSDLIKAFDTLEEAKAAFKNYKSICDLTHGFAINFYFFEEYFIQVSEYDEDYDLINEEIIEFSEII